MKLRKQQWASSNWTLQCKVSYCSALLSQPLGRCRVLLGQTHTLPLLSGLQEWDMAPMVHIQAKETVLNKHKLTCYRKTHRTIHVDMPEKSTSLLLLPNTWSVEHLASHTKKSHSPIRVYIYGCTCNQVWIYRNSLHQGNTRENKISYNLSYIILLDGALYFAAWC